jgi:hypothetical protein
MKLLAQYDISLELGNIINIYANIIFVAAHELLPILCLSNVFLCIC